MLVYWFHPWSRWSLRHSGKFIRLTLWLYVGDFVFFSTSDVFKTNLQNILLCHLTVDFMGAVKWLHGIHFSWCVSSTEVDFHINQSGFMHNLVEHFDLQDHALSPNTTPYCSGIPIDAITSADSNDEWSAQKCRTEAYQSITSSVGWLFNNTCPDL